MKDREGRERERNKEVKDGKTTLLQDLASVRS